MIVERVLRQPRRWGVRHALTVALVGTGLAACHRRVDVAICAGPIGGRPLGRPEGDPDTGPHR